MLHRESKPWIEWLILSYGQPEEVRAARLVAHVSGLNEAPSTYRESLTKPVALLLFLSDGTVHIPGLLTERAWKELQRREEYEAFSALLDKTVHLTRYTLEFSVESENKSQFYLIVDGLLSMSDACGWPRVPSCMSLASVKRKVTDTLRSVRVEESSMGQSGMDLTQLLAEWRSDKINSLLDKIRRSLQPGGLTYVPTMWHLARVADKGEEQFHIPSAQLCPPVEQNNTSLRRPEADRVVGELPVNVLQPPDNPWDVFEPVAIDTSSLFSSPGSPSESLTPDDLQPALPCAVAMVTEGTDERTLPPYQRALASRCGTSHMGSTGVADTLPENSSRAQSHSPPSWLLGTQVSHSGRGGTRDRGSKQMPVPKQYERVTTHRDGTQFAYSYQPTLDVVEALGHYRVPGELLHWCMRYLTQPHLTRGST